jgi:hypothetical protein
LENLVLDCRISLAGVVLGALIWNVGTGYLIILSFSSSSTRDHHKVVMANFKCAARIHMLEAESPKVMLMVFGGGPLRNN